VSAENGNSHQDDVRKLGEMIKSIKVGMLTTVDQDGRLHSRPMATQEVEFDGDLWFMMSCESPKADEIEKDHQVNVSYVDSSNNRYISVSGTGRILKDEKKIKKLWSPAYKAWFPQGLDDPTIALLRVQVDNAEFWDGPSSKIVQLMGFVKAMATGEPYKGGEHEKFAL